MEEIPSAEGPKEKNSFWRNITRNPSLRFLLMTLAGTHVSGAEKIDILGKAVKQKAASIVQSRQEERYGELALQLLASSTVPGIAYERIWASGMTDPEIPCPDGQSTQLGSEDLDHDMKLDMITLTTTGKKHIIGSQMTTSIESATIAKKKQNLLRSRYEHGKNTKKYGDKPDIYCLFSVSDETLQRANASWMDFKRDSQTPEPMDIQEGILVNPYYTALEASQMRGGHPIQYLPQTDRDHLKDSVIFYRNVVDHYTKHKDTITAPQKIVLDTLEIRISEENGWLQYSTFRNGQKLRCEFMR